MKKLAWAAALTSLVGASACTVTSSSTEQTVPSEDSGATPEAAVANDDAASAVETSTTDASSSDAEVTCSTPVSTGSSTCDTCLSAQCCPKLAACEEATDSTSDDAGNTGCIGLFACIYQYMDATPDAGEGDALDICQASHSSAAVTAVSDLWNCRDQSCLNECSQ
jgi:hypothetical protein